MIQANSTQVDGVRQKSKEDEEEMRKRCRGVEGNNQDGRYESIQYP